MKKNKHKYEIWHQAIKSKKSHTEHIILRLESIKFTGTPLANNPKQTK